MTALLSLGLQLGNYRGAGGSSLPLSAIRFPSNGEAPANDNISIYFANPHTNGLPLWGPGNAGVTIIRRIRSHQQTGYYARFWYSVGSLTGDADFIANANSYWGFHPYPPGGAAGVTHNEEVSANSSDYTTTRAGGVKQTVHEVWRTEALRIIYNVDGTKTFVFYTDLPSTANTDVIETTLPVFYGLTEPANPMLTIGESPWYNQFQHERGSFDQAEIKIFDKALSEVDTLSEAASIRSLATPEGIAHIWYGKNEFLTVDDLTCDYGTGRAFSWGSASKGTLVTP